MQTSLARRQRHRRNGNGRGGPPGGIARRAAIALPLFLFGTLLLVGLLGLVGVVAAYNAYSRDLPDPKELLDRLSFDQQTAVFDRTGKVQLAQFGQAKRELVTFGQIPPEMIDATTAVEDHTFWENAGFDPLGIFSAALDTLRGNERGASTITQQLVRARLLPPSAFQGSVYERKLKEIIQSIRLTQEYPGEDGKRAIITAYLNQNFYGNQSYGVAAAAKSYFGKDLQHLDLAQMAILAAIPQSPTDFDLVKNAAPECTVPVAAGASCPSGKSQLVVPADSQIVQRRNYILDLMKSRSVLSGTDHQPSDYDAAMQEKVVLAPQAAPQWRAPHFVWQVRHDLGAILCGNANADACEPVDTGGYQVTTTLDWTMQKVAEKWVKAAVIGPNMKNTAAYLKSLGLPDLGWIETLRRDDIHNGALGAIDYRTGQVLAYVGSADYYSSSASKQFQPQFDVLGAGWRQTGSTFKPISYVTGIEDGTVTAASLFMDVVTDFGGGYTPTDADNLERGPLRLREALEFSLNIPAIKAATEIGPDRVFEMARKFGIRFQKDQNTAGASIAIGTLELHPIDLISAYGALANGGVLMPRTTILSVVDKDGHQVWPVSAVKPAGKAIVSPQAAYIITDILKGNTDPSINPFWGRAKITDGSRRRPAALKTGTTDNTKDLTAMGYLPPPADPNAPAIVAGVWMGNSDNSQTGGIFSLEGPTPVWQSFLTDVSKGTPITDFPEPPGITTATVDAYSGMLPGPFTTKTVDEIFINGTVPTQVDNTKVPVDVDQASGLLWQDGCAGPKDTQGFLDLSGVEPAFPQWKPFTDGWIARAKQGPGVAGGPEKTKTSYFFGSGFQPYGATWGAPFAPTDTCTPQPSPSPLPSCDPNAGPCPSIEPSPSASGVVVGDYRCLTLADASIRLTMDGLMLGSAKPPVASPTWLVASQEPPPGTTVPPGSPVDLSLKDPSKITCP